TATVTLAKECKSHFIRKNLSFLFATSAWFAKHTALAGFYQYAVNRGILDRSPMPIDMPRRPPAFLPYISIREPN
ncbi:hypothetical protein ABTA61_19510, partial [Acinetobacter baumannii]